MELLHVFGQIILVIAFAADAMWREHFRERGACDRRKKLWRSPEQHEEEIVLELLDEQPDLWRAYEQESTWDPFLIFTVPAQCLLNAAKNGLYCCKGIFWVPGRVVSATARN